VSIVEVLKILLLIVLADVTNGRIETNAGAKERTEDGRQVDDNT
jgi:hypothetical protein